MKKEIKEMYIKVIAPYKRITTSSSVWKIGDKPSVSVEYKETNFDSIDIANALQQLAKVFENTNYVSNFELRTQTRPSINNPSTQILIKCSYKEVEKFKEKKNE